MGCWNGTCGLSQMPIKHGDKVVVFPLMPKSHREIGGGGFCYSDGQYKPMSIPIFGEYNDYGSIENVTKNGDIVLEYFLDLIKRKRLTVNEYEPPKTIDELFDMIQEGKIINNTNETVGFMMVHEDIYKATVNEMGNRGIYNQYLKFKGKILKEAQNYINNSKNKKSRCFEDMLESLKKANPDKYKELKELFDNSDFDSESIPDNDFAESFLNSSHGFPMKMIMQRLIDTKDDNLLNDMVDFYIFKVVMSFGRKAWVTQTGAGSQCDELMIHKIIADCINKRVNKVKRNAKQNGYDDPNECIRETLF